MLSLALTSSQSKRGAKELPIARQPLSTGPDGLNGSENQHGTPQEAE